MRSITRRGGLAVLAALAIYLLLGGDLGLNGNDPATTRSAPDAETVTEASNPAPTPGADANVSDASVSREEAEGISRVLAEIEAGKPLPYDQDGASFQNREGRLPSRPQGYYREYTVITPGSEDRGARRLVIGEGGETYYTADHYGSFVQIDPAQFE